MFTSCPEVSSVCVIPGGGWLVTVTVAVCVIPTPLAVADTVLGSTAVELKVPVATPLELVVPPPLRVFPDPVAASTTLEPLTGFPNWSLTVTVIVDEPVPTTIEVGWALTLDCAALIGPVLTVTTGCCVRVTPPATAVTVCEPAPVELNVPVVTPLPFVAAGWVKLLPLPVAERVTAIPLSGLPLPFLTVMVMVLLPPAMNDVGDAPTTEREADTLDAGFTVTDAVWVIAVPLMFAEIVLPSAAVDVNVLVNTPLPLVVPELGVRVLPDPVDARVTLAPLIVSPLPSLATTVMVDDPLLAVNVVGAAETVEFDAETPLPPPPPDEWQAVLPESVYVFPATGTNFQA